MDVKVYPGMKQYRITTRDLVQDHPDDCILSPDDPIHELKATAQMGGLGAAEALAKYNRRVLPVILEDNRGRIQREQNIKPGTDAWFKHWFGKQGI